MPNTDERTPLVQTVVVTRREPRYHHSTLRRFCTILLACLLILVLIGFLLPVSVLPHGHRHRHNHDHDHNHWDWDDRDWSYHRSQLPDSWPQPQGLTFDQLNAILVNTPDAKRVRDSSEYYGAGPCLAGRNLSQAIWTRERWEEAGVKSEIIAYDVYLNYPVDHRLALLKNNEVEYECSLEEDVIDEDPTTGLDNRVPTFHGYSASGNVTAQYVFANAGTHWDFEDLVARNISLKGKIALVKYGRNFRGLKVGKAQELGMVGVVMYSDPEEDGDITEANGYKPYPEGPARNPSAVQRGSTQFINVLPGDPTTPGYPSKPGVPRANPNVSIPAIPSIPISYRDALPLLKALNGHGPNATSFNKYWQGGKLGYKGVNYNIGPSPENVTLNLVNVQNYVTTPIWNVIGIINGTIPDEVIVLGNHRDSWIVGGAGDPHSGSAAMVEVVKSFGAAVAAGWKPLRTIVFASWDGEEYGLLGSTEWVEEFLPWLSSSAVAYLNVDVGVRGAYFSVSASPSLHSVIYNTTSTIPSPKNGSIFDHWNKKIPVLGSGSDFAAFQDLAGVPSVDFGFTRDEKKDPVYHYHSNYDSFHWMDKYGDSTWEYHTTIAKTWSLLAAKLSETPIIQLNATNYAVALQSYLSEIKKAAHKSSIHKSLNFKNLDDASQRLLDAAVVFDAYAMELASRVEETLPWWKWWKKIALYIDVRKVNTKYKLLERSFLYPGGLDGRNWFKHVVYAPGRWTGYSGAKFPGLIESIEDANVTGALKWSRIIEERFVIATDLLEK